VRYVLFEVDDERVTIPRFSIVVPAFESESTIEASIRSALLPTGRALEVIDGSTDGTATVVRSLAREDSRVRSLRQPHRGPSATGNRAIAEARGELWVA
jgi:glycosyltransferase involved in cell wall biosynthesis